MGSSNSKPKPPPEYWAQKYKLSPNSLQPPGWDNAELRQQWRQDWLANTGDSAAPGEPGGVSFQVFKQHQPPRNTELDNRHRMMQEELASYVWNGKEWVTSGKTKKQRVKRGDISTAAIFTPMGKGRGPMGSGAVNALAGREQHHMGREGWHSNAWAGHGPPPA